MSEEQCQVVLEQLLNELKGITSDEVLINKINSKYPGWITHIAQEYSEDYPRFSETWRFILSKSGMQPKKIIIVEEIPTEKTDDNIYQYYLCDILTKLGFVVRRNTELQICHKCGRAILTNSYYNQFKDSIPQILENDRTIGLNFSVDIPDEWQNCCKNC